jgi:hypothetical protein
MGASCDEVGPMPRDPQSFTTETAPQELQFMYKHYSSALTSAKDFLQGVVDFPEGLARSTISTVTSPKIAAGVHTNPLKYLGEVGKDWEHGFERNPFRATGQVVGAGLIGYLATKGIKRLAFSKGVCHTENCPLPVPAVGKGGEAVVKEVVQKESMLFNIAGTSCRGCTTGIKLGLEEKEIHVKFTPIVGKKSTQMVVEDNAGFSVNQIKQFIDDLGFPENQYVELTPT